MGICTDKKCMECKIRSYCMNFGDEGFFSCKEIKKFYEKSKEEYKKELDHDYMSHMDIR